MEEEIGEVKNYFSHVGAIVVEIKYGKLKLGDKIHIKGHTTDFTQTVESMQIERQPINEANEGDLVGIKVIEKARKGDIVYKVIE